ncbi:aquaporin Z [compost metagenome]
MLYFSHISLKEGNYMATKKSTSAAKKSTVKKSTTSTPKTTTKVTTVKAVEAPKKTLTRSFSFNRSPLVGASIAELIGTFLLAAIVITQQGQPIPVLFALVGIVLAIGAFSGAHVNPLLTVGAWVTRKITGVRALAYVVAQALGALLAFVVLSAFVNQAATVDPQMAMLGQSATELFKAGVIPEGKEWAVLFAELLGSTIFAFAVASALHTKEKIGAAFTVGLGLFVALVIAGSAAVYVGGSVILNPAVAIALQAFTGIKDVWPVAIYAIVPLIGGVIGFALNDVLNRETVKEEIL